jgi:hypothetical protein
VLLGDACDAMREGDHELTGSFFCSSPVDEVR